jgi:hypothetical protein
LTRQPFGFMRIPRIAWPALALSLALALPSSAQELWRFDQTASVAGHPLEVLGHPQVVSTDYGQAIAFDGANDALLVDVHPLAGAKTWTWEMIFRPDADGAAAQRVFNLQVKDAATGADIADRMLFEIRIVNGQWCLDSFATSAGQGATLLNCEKLHPLGEWYRVSAVYDGTTFRNYVGDELQGEAALKLAPQGAGHSSVGMRIEARFTSRALDVSDFLKMPPKN